MTEQPTDGPARLRKSGVGVILGGILLAVAATGLSYAVAATVVIALGLVGVVYGDTTDVTQGAVGLLAVGGIGLVEAAPGVGLGLEPAVLAGLVVIFGVFDVLASLLLRRISSAR
jgi:hypothetical protein